MSQIKYQKAVQENDVLTKEVKRMQADLDEVRQIIFAVARQYGRIRIEAEVAESVKTNDKIHMERQENGDWIIDYQAAEVEVKPEKNLLVLEGK